MKYNTSKPMFSFTILLSALLCLVCAASAQFGFNGKTEEETGIYDYSKKIKSAIEKKEVGEPQEVTRTPLFDNLPFLQLKPGDKIVKGHRWHDRVKATEPGYYEKVDYFVLSGGQYFYLSDTKLEAKSRLSNTIQVLLFDWPFSLQSATQIY